MAVQAQIHEKFKVFVGSSISDVAEKVSGFTSDGTIAAKSIGIEFVEASGVFLLSLGYAEGQAGYAVTLTESVVGNLPVDDAATELCAALEAAAAKAGEVLCHELYVDEQGIIHIVFMAKA